MTSTTSLLDLRYGSEAPAATAPLNPVIEALLSHRTVRSFLPDALPLGTIETLVAAAQSAPTSSNLQTWSVVAVEAQATRDRLAELAGNQAHIRQGPLFLAWIADLSRVERIAGRKDTVAAGTDYLEAFLVAAVDAALAAQNALVAAESLGLGTVYIGAMRNKPEEVAELLGLPPGAFTVFGMVVGRPDPARPASVKPRLPQPSVLHRERYAVPADHAQEIGAYDSTLSVFQAEQAMPLQNWSDMVVNRLKGPQSLSGRDRLADALRALGFGLK